ncbi:MAG: hypothetical protein ACNS60_04095 [Candidatus Cyclobacteriaceae bacterium M2_1C_046]
MKKYDTLLNQIQELEDKLQYSDKLNLAVSEKPVSWHIDHSLRVINGVCHTLKNSNPQEYKGSFNLIKLYILFTGHIPRGKGRAPKSVVSPGEVLKEDLIKQVELAKNQIKEIKTLPPKSFFIHPYFGALKLDTSIKFLAIHTNHHLKIIRDILK